MHAARGVQTAYLTECRSTGGGGVGAPGGTCILFRGGFA